MIRQGRVSKALQFDFLGKYSLKGYSNEHVSCMFFGCYKGRNDVATITNHKGLAVICWRGTDILGMTKEDMAALKKDNIKHIAISDYIAKDLDNAGFRYKRFQVTSTPLKFNPVPLGSSVYTYIDKRRPDFYGKPMIDFLSDRYGIIIGADYPKVMMEKIYRRCFIGLRLTQHDGLPNTVIELGLMGRRCVWNSHLPNAMSWKNMDDIIEAIECEKQKCGVIQYDVARKMMSDLKIDDKWLNEKTYIN